MNNLTPLIGILLIGIAIGFALGILVDSLRAKPHPEESRPGEGQAPAEGSGAQILQLSRPEQDGPLVIQVEGQRLPAPGKLASGQQARIRQAWNALQPWFEALDLIPKAAPQASAPETTSPAPTTPGAPVIAPEEGVRRPSLNPLEAFSRAIRSDVAKVGPESKSIVAQIDEILQRKLEGTPLEKRGISLRELPQQGMVVMVGLDQFNEIDGVPDPEIRQVIRESVTEWEHRMGA